MFIVEWTIHLTDRWQKHFNVTPSNQLEKLKISRYFSCQKSQTYLWIAATGVFKQGTAQCGFICDLFRKRWRQYRQLQK